MSPAWRLACRPNASARVGAGLLLALGIALAAAALAGSAAGTDLPFAPLDSHHPLGTDDLGRDVALRLAAGAAPTLAVGGGAALGAIALAATLTLVGLGASWLDAAVLRLADLFNALPLTLVFILVAALFHPGAPALAALLALFSWDSELRVLRLRLREVWAQRSLDAARLARAGVPYLLRRHVGPALAGLLAVQAVALLRRAVFHYAGLAFLGLADPVRPTWGGMISAALPFLALPAARPPLVAAAVCLGMLLTGLALLGQGWGERAR